MKALPGKAAYKAATARAAHTKAVYLAAYNAATATGLAAHAKAANDAAYNARIAYRVALDDLALAAQAQEEPQP